MTLAIALDSRRVALEMHALLRDIDPARWRDEVADGASRRLQAIDEQLARLLSSTWPEGHHRGVQERLNDLACLLRAHAPEAGSPNELREAWMAFRSEAHPAYEALAASLRDWSIHVPSLRPSNIVRNVFHAGWAALGISVVVAVPHPQVLIAVAVAFNVLAWGMEITRRLSPAVNRVLMAAFGPVAHAHERHRVNSATWFATAILVLSLTVDAPAGVAAIAVLGIGDPVAALIGRRWGRVRLLHGRSLEGTLAFFAVSTLTAGLLLTTFYPGLGPNLPWLAAGAASGAGALAELLARRIDDNLAIPLAAAAAATLVLGGAL